MGIAGFEPLFHLRVHTVSKVSLGMLPCFIPVLLSIASTACNRAKDGNSSMVASEFRLRHVHH